MMIRWTGLAPWEFEFPFPGSLTSTFLATLTPFPARLLLEGLGHFLTKVCQPLPEGSVNDILLNHIVVRTVGRCSCDESERGSLYEGQ